MNRIKQQLKKLPSIDPRVFRDTTASIDEDPARKAKYIFIKPTADGKCEITRYARSLTFLEKLKHRRDIKTTTEYLKRAAAPHAHSDQAATRQYAEVLLSKSNKNLAKVTAANEGALRHLGQAEQQAAPKNIADKRIKTITHSPKPHRAKLEKLQHSPRKAVTPREPSPPLRQTTKQRQFAQNVAATNQLIDDLEAIL